MRKHGVYRLPTNMFDPADELPATLTKLNELVSMLNEDHLNIEQRLDTIQQIGTQAPITLTGLTVTGKQGLFHLTWQKILHIDGYILLMAKDTAMSQITGRWKLPDSEMCQYQVPVGNVAVTASFTVAAYRGNRIGNPSATITATTAVYGAAEATPAAPIQAPRNPFAVPIREGTTLP